MTEKNTAEREPQTAFRRMDNVNDLEQVSHDLQGCAAAIMHLGDSLETSGGGVIGTGWLCELLADRLLQSAETVERVMSRQ